MTSYGAAYAELYDLLYADKDYTHEAAFLRDCLARHGVHAPARLLELAAGSGRHAAALRDLGFQVTATDASAGMIEAARVRDPQLELQVADMREIALGGPRFDACLCLFDSLGYLTADRDIARTLGRIHDHLREGGLFVAEYMHAPALLAHYEPRRVRERADARVSVKRTATTALDRNARIAHVAYCFEYQRADGSTGSFEERHSVRAFGVDEFSNMLCAAGLLPIAAYAGYTFDESIVDETWHVIAVARRTASAV